MGSRYLMYREEIPYVVVSVRVELVITNINIERCWPQARSTNGAIRVVSLRVNCHEDASEEDNDGSYQNLCQCNIHSSLLF